MLFSYIFINKHNNVIIIFYFLHNVKGYDLVCKNNKFQIIKGKFMRKLKLMEEITYA